MTRQAFFATVGDYLSVFDHIFSTTDSCLFEAYSDFSQPRRKFSSSAELKTAFVAGPAPDEILSASFFLWSPTAMPKPSSERIKLDPSACDGHTFRYAFRGVGGMAFHFGGIQGGEINYSEFSHFDEAGAKARGLEKGVDWTAFRKLSNKIRYHLRSRLAVSKLPGHAVLPEALEWTKNGYILVCHALLRWRYESDNLKLIAAPATSLSDGGGQG